VVNAVRTVTRMGGLSQSTRGQQRTRPRLTSHSDSEPRFVARVFMQSDNSAERGGYRDMGRKAVGAQRTVKGSSKRRANRTTKSVAKSRPNTTSEATLLLPSELRLLGLSGAEERVVRNAEVLGTESPVIAVVIRDGRLVFPISVRQANSLLHELGNSWITDKEVILPLLHDIRTWLERNKALLD
jgi:hypothetical protein